MSEQPRCETCRFWSADVSALAAVKYGENIGECRRHCPRGPIILALPLADGSGFQQAVFAQFAPVPKDDWCGDYQFRT